VAYRGDLFCWTEYADEQNIPEDTMNRISRKIRRNRNMRDFERALRNASPTMRQELYAAANHQSFRTL
jgi:hypothetical protein